MTAKSTPPQYLTVDTADSINTGLQGFWPLSDGASTAVDLSGNANDGTVGSTVTWPATNKGVSANSDGANVTGGIDLGNPTALQITGGLTISAWIRSDNATPASNEYIVSKYDASASQRAYGLVLLTTGNVRMTYQSAGTPYDNAEDVDSTGTLSSNVWHHVVGTFEPSTAGKIYIDGSLDTSNTVSVPASIFGSTADVYISGIDGASPPSNCVDGDIQNVRIYNRALSAAEISRLYQDPWAGTDRAIEPSPTVKDLDTSSSLITNLVGWWPLTEFGPQDTLAYDISGNGNHGVANGGVQRQFTDLVRSATFDGVDDIFDASPYSIGTNSSMTFTGWFRYTTTVGSATIVTICRDDGGTLAQKKRAITVNSSGLAECSLQDSTAYVIVNGTTVFEVGRWYFVAGTIVKTGTSFDVEIFVNGVSEGTSSGTGTEPTPYTKTCIGATRRFNGDITGVEPCNIQNVRIYDRALSAAEVQTLYDDPWVGLATDSLVYAYYSAAFLQRLG